MDIAYWLLILKSRGHGFGRNYDLGYGEPTGCLAADL